MEESGVVKRKRSPNWWPSEKKLLVDLVEEHFSVIENKKTDAVTMRKKKAEWEIVAQAYNSSTSLCKRSAENLKAAWENLKKIAKKDLANSQMKDFKTDSGPPKEEKEDSQYTLYARVIDLLIKPGATRLSIHHDSDQVVQEPVEGIDSSTNHNITEDELVIQTVAEERVEVLMNDDWTPSLRPDVVTVADIASYINNNTFSENENAEVEEGSEKSTWAGHTPKNRKPCLNGRPCLPVAGNATLQKLHQSKIAALELQMKHAIEEREEARRLHTVEVSIKKFQLKQEKLKLKILMSQMKEKENK